MWLLIFNLLVLFPMLELSANTLLDGIDAVICCSTLMFGISMPLSSTRIFFTVDNDDDDDDDHDDDNDDEVDDGDDVNDDGATDTLLAMK